MGPTVTRRRRSGVASVAWKAEAAHAIQPDYKEGHPQLAFLNFFPFKVSLSRLPQLKLMMWAL